MQPCLPALLALPLALSPLIAAAPPDTPPTAAMFGMGPGRNLVERRARGLPSTWDTRPGKQANVLWSVELGTRAARSGPVVHGGRVYIGTNNQHPRDKAVRGDKGVMMCFRASDGTFLWQITHDKLDAGRVVDWPEEGILSSPAVEGDRLYYVSNRGELVCADAVTGRVVWRLDMLKELKVHPHNRSVCSPLLVGDTLFVVTGNGVDQSHNRIPRPDAPNFLAVDKKTGKVRWSSNLPGKNILHGQWSNPVYSEAGGRQQVIFPGGDGWLYSFEPRRGRLLWKFDCNPKGARGRKRSEFVGTPVMWEGKLYIGVGQDPEHKKDAGHFWCIDVTKTPKDKNKDLSPWSDPNVVAPSKFDPKDPRNKDSALVWHYGGAAPEDYEKEYHFGRTLSTCAVHDGLCYAADFDGSVYCFDARTGKKHWEQDMKAETWSSPFCAAGHVFIGNERGEMLVFRHGRTQRLVSKIEGRGMIRSVPTAAGDVLFMVSENPCRLWALKK
jgi:outer membrane protein assembly factor BamB